MPIPKSKRRHHKPSRLAQILPISGLVLLVIAILVLKENTQVIIPTANGTKLLEEHLTESLQVVIPQDSSEGLPEAELARALNAGQPALAFFHSNNCHQCIVMIETISQVYPEFADTVALVDINVYDEHNERLLQVVRIQYIPTLIFYDRTGNKQVSVGVMEAEQLRQNSGGFGW